MREIVAELLLYAAPDVAFWRKAGYIRQARFAMLSVAIRWIRKGKGFLRVWEMFGRKKRLDSLADAASKGGSGVVVDGAEADELEKGDADGSAFRDVPEKESACEEGGKMRSSSRDENPVRENAGNRFPGEELEDCDSSAMFSPEEDAEDEGDAGTDDECFEAESLDREREFEKSLEGLRAEVASNRDKYLRAIAELENFKKRAAKERSELLRYAGEGLARDLLEVVDHLELAVAHDCANAEGELLKGVELILNQLVQVLERHGIKSESSLGKQFDPNTQSALSSVPTSDSPSGLVLEEFKKAYFFKDKLLRPAQVVVAVSPEDDERTQEVSGGDGGDSARGSEDEAGGRESGPAEDE